MAGRFILVLLAAAAATTTTTQPTACMPPGTTNSQAADCVVYETRAGDTPYTLAERFYGRAWMGYQIAEANRWSLTREGFFPPGTKILIPPDLNGRPVDVNRVNRRY